MSTRKCAICEKKFKTNPKKDCWDDWRDRKSTNYKYPIDMPKYYQFAETNNLTLKHTIPIFKNEELVGFQSTGGHFNHLYIASPEDTAKELAALAKSPIGIKYHHMDNYYDDGKLEYSYKRVLFKDVSLKEQKRRLIHKQLGGEENFLENTPKFSKHAKDFPAKAFWSFDEPIFDEPKTKKTYHHFRTGSFLCAGCVGSTLYNFELREKITYAFRQIINVNVYGHSMWSNYSYPTTKKQAVRHIENWWLRVTYNPNTFIGAKTFYQRGIKDELFEKEQVDIKYWTDEQFLDEVPMPQDENDLCVGCGENVGQENLTEDHCGDQMCENCFQKPLPWCYDEYTECRCGFQCASPQD